VDAHILVVEDDLTVAEVVVDYLNHAGLESRHAVDGAAALEIAATWPPDLVVLDLMLPGVSGLEVCRRLREGRNTRAPLPVIMLTALGEESDRVLGLESGADDYVTKPFSVEELLARLRAALRRADAPAEPVVELGDLRIDLEKRAVSVRGEPVQLTPNEFALLRVLARNPGKLLTHGALLREVWGRGYGDESHYLHVYVSQLRRKLEADPARPRYILTEPGAGYRLAERP
jgi:DNA-binding response OmpR family regulator